MALSVEPRSVLLVAYYFPPSGSVGARRTLKFARYLPGFNWRPVVLTVSEDVFSEKDFSSAEQMRHARVYRTRCWSFSRLARKLRKQNDPTGGADLQTERHSRAYCLAVGVKRLLQSLLIPDTEVGWLPFALYHGLKIIRREKIKVIYASAPPPTTLIVGTLLSLFSGRPLVLDLRDSWAIHPDWLYLEENQGALRMICRLRLFTEGVLEKLVLRRAKVIVLNTEAMREVYQLNHPAAAKNMVTITNGYDADDFKSDPELAARDDYINLVFVGNYYGFHSPDHFLRGLHHLVKHRPEVAKLIKVCIVGGLETASSWQLIQDLGLREVVKVIGRVPHPEAVAWLKKANALLLTLPPVIMAEWWIPAKLFEYLAVGKPIFGVMPEGAAARLIRESGRGVPVDPRDPAKISEGLYRLCVSAQSGGDGRTNHEQFEYRVLTNRLADVFERATMAG